PGGRVGRVDPQRVAAHARPGADPGRARGRKELPDRIVPADARFDPAHRRGAGADPGGQARHRLSRPPRRADRGGDPGPGPRVGQEAVRPRPPPLRRGRRSAEPGTDPPGPRPTGVERPGGSVAQFTSPYILSNWVM